MEQKAKKLALQLDSSFLTRSIAESCSLFESNRALGEKSKAIKGESMPRLDQYAGKTLAWFLVNLILISFKD